MDTALVAINYGGKNWKLESLQERLGFEKIYVNIAPEPTIVGHNLYVQFDHHWGGGCDRIEKYESARDDWERETRETVRKPFISHFSEKVAAGDEDELEYWKGVYKFLREKGFL
jgi:hypothetical protein